MDVKVTKSLLMTALITGSVLWGGTAAFAEESVGEFTLDQMVVTATRTEKRDVDVPASTEILTHDKIVASGATNAMEALSKVNGIEFKNYFPGGSAMTTMTPEINIRGLSTGTLVMVNGNPLNLNNKYVIDAIPTEAIEKIEIIKGGGAIMYGSEAMAGVVNIITKKKGTNSVSIGYGNYGQQKYNVALGNEKFKVNYDLKKWGELDNLSASANPSTNSSYSFHQDRNHKENIGIGYNITDELSFEYNHLDSSVDYHKTLTKSGAFQQWRETYTKQDLFQLNYNGDSLKSHMWYTKNKINYYGGVVPGVMQQGSLTETENYTYGIDLQKDFKLSEKALLTVGGNFKKEDYKPVIKSGANALGSDEKGRNAYALFAQLDQKLTDKDSIIISGRETWTGSSTNGEEYNDFSASGQYVHKLDDNKSLYFSAAQSFIMPSFSQMYPSGLAAGNPNPDLKPQKGTNYEIGYKEIAGNHVWKLALFNMNVKDNITASWKNNVWNYKNTEFRNTGFEASVAVEASDKFNYDLGLTIHNPENKIDNEPKKVGWQRKFGKYQLKGGVEYKLDKFKAGFTGSYVWDRYSSPSSKDSYKIKPYFLTTLTATYSPNKNSDVSLIIDNVLDRRDNLSNTMGDYGAYYATPANFLISYTYKF